MTIQSLWHGLTTPRAVDVNEARREYMTRVILVILNLVGLVFLIAFGIGAVAGILSWVTLVPTLAVDSFFLVSLWLTLRGHWRLTGFIPTIVFFLLALSNNYRYGVGAVAMLQYAIVVLLAAILQGRKMQWGALVCCVGGYLGIGYMYVQKRLPLPPVPETEFASWAIPVVGMLAFISILQWFYTGRFQNALEQIRVYASDAQVQAAELTKINAQLEREMAERARLQQQALDAQQQVISELSAPIIPLMDQIIVLPLVGAIDTNRARDLTRTLLAGISEYRVRVVILDITGVPVVDSGIAAHLDKTIQAARLKGARVIITGISDAVAEAIVDLGIDWSGIETRRDLQTGLIVALNSMGVRLARNG